MTTNTVTLDPAAGRGPDWLDAFLSARLPQVIDLRRRIHARPELSRQEHATTALVAAVLAGAGIDASVLPVGTGLTAELPARAAGRSGADAPIVALRADMDALPIDESSGLSFSSVVPGVAHACGHDVHTAILLGTALALAAAPPLPARVTFVFQPAEEAIPGGAHDVVDAGLLANASVAYALHCDPSIPVGTVGTRVGAITSSCDIVAIGASGPGGHTSRPQLTVDLVAVLGLLATELPRRVLASLPADAGAVMAWGAIDAGGRAANVIPARGQLRGTLRLADMTAWDGAETLVRRLAEDIVAPFGARVDVDYRRGVPPTINDPVAVGAVRLAAAAALGPGRLVESPQSTGGEDFAVMAASVPGALVRLGVWDGIGPQVDLHTAAFRADERAIAVGIRTLVHLVLAAGDPHAAKFDATP